MTTTITYNEIYQQYFQRIVNYLSRTVGSDDAKDLAQEVFLKVFNSIDKFENKSSTYTWVYKIATNLLVDKMRKKQIIVDRCNLIDKELFSKSKVEYLKNEFRIVQDEMHQCICSYIKILPLSYRTIIILREYESMSIDQIAEIMNLKIDNTKKLLLRARKKLKTVLNEGCLFYYNELNQFSCEKK
ncbi:MAG: hypothetical protein A2086_03455 [Spirochaetes bacterium GWD1_27_9]|nr:MAG: hypothetical protein A2Z98_11440 [Spirochaetes bacterium GWB1_27_13]OHD25109.1 MAG: hypothetical protein A2Y34_12280 [Spirochaetes bacterium GWC1_27_15]OHD39131.1 MAG: hypothetical protein A2086_03455 [Spirochaetes bacterium GWD1_27_9]